MKLIYLYENTWNANENIYPHEDLYMKVCGSLIHNCHRPDTIQMFHPLANE